MTTIRATKGLSLGHGMLIRIRITFIQISRETTVTPKPYPLVIVLATWSKHTEREEQKQT